MEEMLEDTFESLEDDDLEDLADQEVEKVLHEVTAGNQTGWGPLCISAALPHNCHAPTMFSFCLNSGLLGQAGPIPTKLPELEQVLYVADSTVTPVGVHVL